MGKIKHRLPVLDGKTDKEKIAQLSDALFQLIRELNLEMDEAPTQVKQGVNSPNIIVQGDSSGVTKEVGALKTICDDLERSVSNIETKIEVTTSSLSIVNGKLDNLPTKDSGTTTNSYGTSWNYTKWSDGELEYWRTGVYSGSTPITGTVLFTGNDKYYPIKYRFKEIPALSVSVYALDSDEPIKINMEGMADTLAKNQVPETGVSTTTGATVPGLVFTIYARGRTS